MISRNCERMKEVYRMRRAAHQCIQCGTDLPEGETKVLCPDCRVKRQQYYKAYRALRVKLGRCLRCGKVVEDRAYQMCSSCREIVKMGIRARRRAACAKTK